MPTKDRFTESLDDFNPYYAPYYDDESKNSPKGKKSKTNSENSNNSNSSDSNKNLLRRAENSAVSRNEPSFGKNDTDSPWKNNVRGKTPVIPGPKGIKLTKSKKGIVVLTVILLLLVGGGIFLGSSHLLLPAALSTLITEATDTQYASNTSRSNRLITYMLQHDNITTTGWNGLARYKKMSNTLKTNLANNHITIEGSGSSTVLKWGNDTIDANSFSSYYRNNPEFRDAFTKARHGRILGFFDDVAERVASNLGLSRNVLKNSKTTGDSDADAENFNKIMLDQNQNSSTTVDTGRVEDTEEPLFDNDGNPILNQDGTQATKTVENGVRETAAQSNVGDSADANAKASNYISGVIDGARKATKFANAACMISKVGNMIAAVAAATEIYQSIQIAMPFGESVSKMKAGYGSSSAINEAMARLTTPEDSTVEDYENYNGSGDLSTTTTRKAAVQNPALLGVLSDQPINAKSVSNYSFERIGSALSSSLLMSVGSMYVCEGVSAANAVVSIAVTITSFGATIIGSVLLDMAVSIGVNIAVSAFLSFLVPTLAKVLFTNPWLNATGDSLGAVVMRGFAASNFKFGISGSSQSPSSKEAILAYNKVNNDVIALDAEVDRMNRSPFDITSKNTFLGSIAYSLLPTTLSNSTSIINALTRTTSKSLSSLIGSAHAEGEGSSYTTTLGDCSTLNSIGAEGDVFCNTIGTSDVNTINLSPDDEKYREAIEPQLNCEGETCTIRDSKADCALGQCELAKYIKYCDERQSPFGIVDTNILSELADLFFGNDVISAIFGSIPIVGDVLDLLTAASNAANMNWANGQNCVNNGSEEWNDEYRYYQLFVQDNRLLDNLSENTNNPVTSFIDKYYAENPLDNSYSGYIARISGISKQDAEDLIAIAEYYQFLDTYDPSTRIAMITENTTIQSADSVIANFDSSRLDLSTSEPTPPTETFLAKQSEQYIIYADIRNRSYAV